MRYFLFFLLFVVCVSPVAAYTTTNIRYFWTFDNEKSSGLTTNDSVSGYVGGMSLQNYNLWGNRYSPAKESLYFNGSLRVTIPNDRFIGSHTRTQCALIHINSSYTGNRYMFSEAIASAESSFYLNATRHPIWFGKCTSGNKAAYSNVSVNLNEWTLVCGGFSGGQIRVFVNGQQTGNQSGCTGLISGLQTGTYIGSDAQNNNRFIGSMAFFGAWEGLLSQSNQLAWYNEIQRDGVARQYPFNPTPYQLIQSPTFYDTVTALNVTYRPIDYDNATLDTCRVYLNGTVIHQDSSVANNSENYYNGTVWLSNNKNYVLWVNCTDGVYEDRGTRVYFNTGCVPAWVCNGYSGCNESDESACNSVTDAESCGLNYTGDYSEFSPLVCDYCVSDVVLESTGECVLHSQVLTFRDLNYSTCCNVTGLGSDCPQNETATSTQYCTRFEYDAGDISESTIDGVTRVILTVSSFVGVIVLFAVVLLTARTLVRRR